ncbi:hypothetical protein COHA_006438 [Chlorella ohadii]|uniref:peptide-methionine (S)-S-oxide reductase n=1 Tax=Chlorella ohadii TaxID=2649997 RepID=A0AAD5DLF9_9CHLO|nr:hypothetical protein COHA_006438 [Chlorella ohadii]
MGAAMSHGSNKPAAWPPANRQADEQLATFAGGCFWSVELAFQRVPGVVATCAGYAQGQVDQPTYEQVCSGRTGHTEAVQLTYKPSEVTFDQLCDTFLAKIDPKQKGGRFGRGQCAAKGCNDPIRCYG